MSRARFNRTLLILPYIHVRVTIISKGPDKPVPESKKRLMMEEDAKGNGDPLIPKKDSDPLSSGLTAEVKSTGSNVFNFDLKD